MLDHNSMYNWMVHGEAYPARSTWYADTSTIDQDNNSDGLLDFSGLNISGINMSLSGEYHLGEHPDSTLRSKQGGDVPILVVDEWPQENTRLFMLIWIGTVSSEMRSQCVQERRHPVSIPMETAYGMFQAALYTGSRMEL